MENAKAGNNKKGERTAGLRYKDYLETVNSDILISLSTISSLFVFVGSVK